MFSITTNRTAASISSTLTRFWLATNLFSGNPGGGAYIVSGVTVTNVKNTYVGNTGGGLELESLTTAVSTGNTFSGNSYSGYGGAELIMSPPPL